MGAVQKSQTTSAGVQEILLQSQALLLMSDFEGLPVALLEAMAAGVVPVVRSIPSGIPEVVHQGETGLLVSDNPDDAADALLTLAGNPALWHRCSNAARQLVEERFSIDRCHQQWLDLLRSMAAEAKPNYPIQGLQGIQLRCLSPLLLAPYRRQPLWTTLRVWKRLNTRVAQLKGLLKQTVTRSD